MLVAWKDGEPELRFSLKREFAKGMHDKEQQMSGYIPNVYDFETNDSTVLDLRTFSTKNSLVSLLLSMQCSSCLLYASQREHSSTTRFSRRF
jgi:hypothetical protein